MTVASMTGFARVTGEHGTWQWAWEVKSVNARSLDIRLRTPPGHDRLEMAARDAVSKRFKRGSFNLSLALQRDDPGQAERPTRINRALLDQLVEEAQRYGGRVAPDPPRIETLLAIRGVVEAVEPQEDDDTVSARMDAMLDSLVAALSALGEARNQEGAHLKPIFMQRLDELAGLRKEASEAESTRPAKRMEQLRMQVSELLEASPALPEDRLAQEVALLVTKGDIREELDRLDAHIDSARELLDQGGVIGRRLDFLCQELTREANTVCSKSNDVELTRVGLAMKATVEQFREQVQNVE